MIDRLEKPTNGIASIRYHSARYRYEVLGTVCALLVFLWGISYPLADRFRGDAVSYFNASLAIHDPWQALTQLNPVFPNGFPSFLALLRWLATPFGSATPDSLTLVGAIALFVLHVVAVTYFLNVTFEWVKGRTSLEIWPWTKVLLYLSPGLILHTTVLLADTISADLLMVSFALGLRGRWIGAGLALGYCTWMRQAYLPLMLAFAGVALIDGLLKRKLRHSMAPLLIGLAVSIGVPLGTCATQFHSVCLADPTVVKDAAEGSMALGLATGRIRWSGVVPTVIDGGTASVIGVPDEFLKRNFGDACPIPSLSCIASRTHLLPILVLKKAVALHDNYYAQPYAVDGTPTWYRQVSRAFGAVAFVGLFSCLLIAWLLRKGTFGWMPLLISLSPWIIVGTHAFFHVEPRYGLGSVAVCLIAAIAGTRIILSASPFGRTLGLAAIVIFVGIFYWQTRSWDSVDQALRPAGASPGSQETRGPPSAPAQEALAESARLYQQGLYDDSIAAARKAIALQPSYSEAYNNVAAAYASKGMWSEAVQAAEMAIRLKPDFQLARNNLAWARGGAAAQQALIESVSLYQQGLYDDSIAAARRALSLRADYPEAYNNVAAAYASKGMWDEAIAAAEEAIRLKPDFQLARNNLAWARRGKAKGGAK